jgi:hypothetical protein
MTFAAVLTLSVSRFILRTNGCPFGVMDHCLIDNAHRGEIFWNVADAWGGKQGGFGSWADPPFFGSDKFFSSKIVSGII